MIYRQFQPLLCAFIALALLNGCDIAYKQTITQGTLFETNAVDQLKIGMTKEQVQFLIGQPILDDPFLKDQWKYIHLVARPDKKLFKKQLTLHFENNLLTKISGDFAKPTKDETETEKTEIENPEAQ